MFQRYVNTGRHHGMVVHITNHKTMVNATTPFVRHRENIFPEANFCPCTY